MRHVKREYNPDTGITHDYYWDDIEQKMTVRNRHKVGAILDQNKRAQAGAIDGRYGNEMMHHVGDIPIAVVHKWKVELGVDVFDKNDMPKVKRLLTDPEYRYLRSNNKRL